MMKIIFLLLSIAPAYGQAPNCTPLPTVCPSGMKSCTFTRTCINGSGCLGRQWVYIQDCSPSPLPAFCTSSSPQGVAIKWRASNPTCTGL
jgi:hypothetical protein